MTKIGAYHSEENYLDWFWNMDFTPEELTDIWSARSALSRQTELAGRPLPTRSQMSRVDWYVHNVSRPSIIAGVRQTLGWNIQGYWEPRYVITGIRGLFGWPATRSIIQQRTGITPAHPYGPYY